MVVTHGPPPWGGGRKSKLAAHIEIYFGDDYRDADQLTDEEIAARFESPRTPRGHPMRGKTGSCREMSEHAILWAIGILVKQLQCDTEYGTMQHIGTDGRFREECRQFLEQRDMCSIAD